MCVPMLLDEGQEMTPLWQRNNVPICQICLPGSVLWVHSEIAALS